VEVKSTRNTEILKPSKQRQQMSSVHDS